MKNQYLKIAYGVTLCSCLAIQPAHTQKKGEWNQPFIKAKKDAPNILWICTDQQRWNTIHALGNPFVNTPNIDKLVNDGISFNYAFCQSPLSTPSRASFLTGMYPSSIQVTKNGIEKWPESVPLITKTLKDAGYECGLAGKFHLSSAMANRPEKRPEDDGYQIFHYSHSPYQGGSTNDYINYYKTKGIDILELKNELGYVPAEYHQTRWCTDMAIQFIEEKREWPWMFSLNIYDPHNPLDPPAEYVERYDIDNLPLPPFIESDIQEKGVFNNVSFQSVPRKMNDDFLKKMTARYWAQIDLIDENVGRILRALEETGQLDNTLIIFSSDHGDMLGDHGMTAKGCRFYEGLVRVPLIFYYPQSLKKGLKSEALVELIDIVPTILEITGLPVPGYLDGKSLYPILTGQEDCNYHKDFVRCEYYESESTSSGKLSYGTMYRTREYKLVNYHGHEDGELFDLKKDPEEFHNQWNNAAYEQIRFSLMKESFSTTAHTIDRTINKIARY